MSKCSEPELGSLLHAYEIDGLSEGELDRFEVHLLSCEHCYSSAQEFEGVATLLRTDEDVKALVREAARETIREPGTFWKTLWNYLWPEAPLLMKPALAYLLVLALLVPAYRGFRGKVSPDGTIQPAQIISCFPLRDADPEVFRRSSSDNGIIGFYFMGAVPGEPYRVIVRAENDMVVYQDDNYTRFDEHGTGWLILSLKTMPPGNYHLSISDSDPDTPTTQEYDFLIED